MISTCSLFALCLLGKEGKAKAKFAPLFALEGKRWRMPKQILWNRHSSDWFPAIWRCCCSPWFLKCNLSTDFSISLNIRNQIHDFSQHSPYSHQITQLPQSSGYIFTIFSNLLPNGNLSCNILNFLILFSTLSSFQHCSHDFHNIRMLFSSFP